jgi:ferredoxin, 2Fe-2S
VEEDIPVNVTPDNIVLHCKAGETLIKCAWRHGYYWPTVCGGIADCGACHCELLDGIDDTGILTPAEEIFFRTRPRASKGGNPTRLACCMTINGPVTVFKAGVKLR